VLGPSVTSQRELTAREAVEEDDRVHPSGHVREIGIVAVAIDRRRDREDALFDLCEWERVELAERSGELRGESAHLRAGVRLDERRIDARAFVRPSKMQHAFVFAAEITEIAGRDLHVTPLFQHTPRIELF